LPLEFIFISSIEQVSKQQWNALTGIDYPFTRYEFLHALELSGAVDGGEDSRDELSTTCDTSSGWQTHHLLVKKENEIIAVMPCYLKYHSFGEYVFDHAWADAYERYGQQYYPKLVTAIPFTPVSGQRICIAKTEDHHKISKDIQNYLIEYCQQQRLSSWHLLFPTKTCSDGLSKTFMQRKAVHFQWFNEGYDSFEDFLSTFSSRKRKNLKKERLKVSEQGIALEVYEGNEIPSNIWEPYHHFYQMTYAKLSGHGGYLPKLFFQQVAKTMPENLVLVLAKKQEYVAGALNFRDSKTLYGRYWGCNEEVDHLHFETCYYQGIDYCIRHGLSRFDPGVQGEHKIQRGFRPVYTYSNHWVADPNFEEAIRHFLKEESVMVEKYREDACNYLPFKQTICGSSPL